MTFYELEKECKKRKFKKIIFLIMLIIVFISGFCFFKLNFSKKSNRKIVKEKIVDKNVSLTGNNKEKIKKKIKKENKNSKINTLKFVLPKINQRNFELNQSAQIKNLVNKREKNLSKKEKNSTHFLLKSTSLPSFDTCISLAKKYLKQKDYQDALKWAKFANIQNKKNPASWIISAKALYYMGKKSEAIKLLRIYETYYNNKEVDKLLKELENE